MNTFERVRFVAGLTLFAGAVLIFTVLLSVEGWEKIGGWQFLLILGFAVTAFVLLQWQEFKTMGQDLSLLFGSDKPEQVRVDDESIQKFLDSAESSSSEGVLSERGWGRH